MNLSSSPWGGGEGRESNVFPQTHFAPEFDSSEIRNSTSETRLLLCEVWFATLLSGGSRTRRRSSDRIDRRDARSGHVEAHSGKNPHLADAPLAHRVTAQTPNKHRERPVTPVLTLTTRCSRSSPKPGRQLKLSWTLECVISRHFTERVIDCRGVYCIDKQTFCPRRRRHS